MAVAAAVRCGAVEGKKDKKREEEEEGRADGRRVCRLGERR